MVKQISKWGKIPQDGLLKLTWWAKVVEILLTSSPVVATPLKKNLGKRSFLPFDGVPY